MNIWECIDRNPFTCFCICVLVGLIIEGIIINTLKVIALKITTNKKESKKVIGNKEK